MDRVLVAALAVAALGMAGLGTLSHQTRPVAVSLSDVPRHADRTVSVEARLAAIAPTSAGGTRLVLTDGNASLTAFVDGEVSALPGDTLRVTGRAAAYRGSWQLAVSAPEDVTRVKGWDDEAVPLGRLAARPWEHLGFQVRTAGSVEREGSAHWLVDAPAGARMRLSGASLPLAWVEVEALVEYEEDAGRFALRALSLRPGTEDRA